MRRYLSCTIVRAQSLCLLNRVCYLGEGGESAGGRREAAKRAGEARRAEADAFYQSHVRGRGGANTGQFYT